MQNNPSKQELEKNYWFMVFVQEFEFSCEFFSFVMSDQTLSFVI